MKLLLPILGSLIVGIAAAPLLASDSPPGKLEMLHGTGMRSIIVGQWLPDRTVKQAAFEYSESFEPDGTWQSSRQERALLMLAGVWNIKGDYLCVQITEAPWGNLHIGDVRCRNVRWNPTNGNIAMADMGSGGAGDALVVLSRPIIKPLN